MVLRQQERPRWGKVAVDAVSGVFVFICWDGAQKDGEERISASGAAAKGSSGG